MRKDCNRTPPTNPPHPSSQRAAAEAAARKQQQEEERAKQAQLEYEAKQRKLQETLRTFHAQSKQLADQTQLLAAKKVSLRLVEE